MAATGGVLRIIAIFLLLISLSKSFAVAGDQASRHTLGFSPDGRYFAFEQYGVQDGSGFPYSEIFIIEVEADRWVSGTPIRVRLEDVARNVEEARSAAHTQAAPLLRKLAVGEPGRSLGKYPREASIEGWRWMLTTEDTTFGLLEHVLPSAECAKYTDLPMKGFTLDLRQPDGKVIILHRDEALPAARNCPLGYHIAEVLRHDSEGGTSYAVMLYMSRLGFEGPDGRFLAVTRRLP